MKTCSKCGETKEFSEFYKRKRAKDGYMGVCAHCFELRRAEIKKDITLQLKASIRRSIIMENKILALQGKKLCSSCKEIHLIENTRRGYCLHCYTIKNKKWDNTEARLKYRQSDKYKKGLVDYYLKNKETIDAYRKTWISDNSTKVKERAARYRENNRDKFSEASKRYYQKKKLEKLQALEAQNDNSI